MGRSECGGSITGAAVGGQEERGLHTATWAPTLAPHASPLPPRCPAPQDKLSTRILGQILYVMQSSQASGKQRIAVALSQLTTKEQPSGAQLRLIFLEKKGLDVLLEMVQVRGQRRAGCAGRQAGAEAAAAARHAWPPRLPSNHGRPPLFALSLPRRTRTRPATCSAWLPRACSAWRRAAARRSGPR